MTDLSGEWKATHWYPSNKQPGEEECTHNIGTFQKSGNQFVFESKPEGKGSYFFVRLTLSNDGLATGTWYETADPEGEYEGSEYSGAFQALLNEAGDKLEGLWAGAGRDREKGGRRIYTGRLKFEKV